MSEQPLDISYLETLPPEWQIDLLPTIQHELGRSSYKIVVFDDDPTGTQTVRDIPVLTTWTVDALEAELAGESPVFFILTNSRSLTEEAACDLAGEIGGNLLQASENTGVRVVVISRSDSTLRGHFPSEVDAAARALHKEKLPYLLIPFFLEGGAIHAQRYPLCKGKRYAGTRSDDAVCPRCGFWIQSFQSERIC